jgi:outer membrane cobalamin receptor
MAIAHRRKFSAGVLLAALSPATGAVAHTVPLERIEVAGHYDNSIGSSDAASQGTISAKLIEARPLSRPGEVLELVPGVVITQHSGAGKANQYFLRGFNLDHGTDFATTVAGMPVNMPTHGHGQGYR